MSDKGILRSQLILETIPCPSTYGINDKSVTVEFKKAQAFIRIKNARACVPVSDQVLAHLEQHICKEENDGEKRSSLIRLAQIMSRFKQYQEAYFFYHWAYKLSDSSSLNENEEDKRMHYIALLGLGKLISTGALRRQDDGDSATYDFDTQPLFEYLNTLFPGEAASCML